MADKISLTIILAIGTALVTFIFERMRRVLEFRARRKSIIVGLFAEVSQIVDAFRTAYINEEKFQDIVENSEARPVLLFTDDFTLMNRIRLEDLNLPSLLISSIVSFYIAKNELFQLIDLINGEEFRNYHLSAQKGYIREVNPKIKRMIKDGDRLEQIMKENMPSVWFEDIEFEARKYSTN